MGAARWVPPGSKGGSMFFVIRWASRLGSTVCPRTSFYNFSSGIPQKPPKKNLRKKNETPENLRLGSIDLISAPRFLPNASIIERGYGAHPTRHRAVVGHVHALDRVRRTPRHRFPTYNSSKVSMYQKKTRLKRGSLFFGGSIRKKNVGKRSSRGRGTSAG
jgi:hypothetical protein